MSMFRRTLALLALCAVAASPALADHSALQYIPSDCEVGVLIDFDPIFSDEDFKPLVTQAAGLAASQGVAMPLDKLSSFAMGVDLPENMSVMTFGQPGSPRPEVFFAARAAEGAMGGAKDQLTQTLTAGESNGRQVYNSPEGVLTFDESMSTMFGASGAAPTIDRSLAAMGGKNFAGNAGFNPGGGALDKPFVHVHVSGIEGILGQIAAFAAMGMMQTPANAPEEREHLMGIQKGVPLLGKIKVLEISGAVQDDEVIFAIRVTMPSEADAAGALSVVEHGLALSQLQGEMTADDIEKLDIEQEGDVLSIASATPKTEVVQGLSMVMMMAAMQMGGGGGGY